MYSHPPFPDSALRAAAFFRQVGLERLLLALRQKYIQLGQVGGQVQLDQITLAERRELASFLGRPPYQGTTLRVKLATIDIALRQSGFQCSLTELLAAAFPDQPLITRPVQRAAHASQQELFYQALSALTTDLLPSSLAQQWLSNGPHGLPWLYARYKNASPTEQEQQLSIISQVASLLNQLPPPASPARLGLFAQRTSGDPHSLDLNRPLGRLFLQALGDLFGSPDLPSRQSRVQDVQLYQQANLLVDTISSHVAVFHLTGALLHDGSLDPLPAAAGARILLLPLCQLQQWRAASSATSSLYILENPQVFETIVAHFQTLSHLSSYTFPTLICTSGWPSVASLQLLDLLLAGNPANHLYYSGDFDLKGLQIATYLQESYPLHCSLWRLDPSAYQIALGADGVSAPPADLALLETLPPSFSALVAQMQQTGKWAYQEGITDLLLHDCLTGLSP